MKKIILIALMGVLSLTCFSQVTTSTDSKGMTAGDHLEQAGDARNGSLVVGALGLALVGVMVIGEDSNSDGAAYVVSAVAGVTMLIMRITANNHIKKAGVIMNQNQGVSLGVTKSGGLGVAYNF